MGILTHLSAQLAALYATHFTLLILFDFLWLAPEQEGMAYCAKQHTTPPWWVTSQSPLVPWNLKRSCSADPRDQTDSKKACRIQERPDFSYSASCPGTSHNLFLPLTEYPRAVVLQLEWTLESPGPVAINTDRKALHKETQIQEIGCACQECIFFLCLI